MGRHGAGSGQSRRRSLAVELLVGITLSIILALVVALAGAAMNESSVPVDRATIVPALEAENEDLDPRDPLVICTQYVTHTHCVREPT